MFFASVLAIIAMVAASCSKHDEPDPSPEPHPDNNSVSRTVLVYMVANNNLHTGGDFDGDDITEMRLGAINGNIGNGRLLVYHSVPSGIVLKEITSEGIDTLKVYDTSETSVSAARMQQVLADTKELAPAASYGMIFWSHANGWLQDGIQDQVDPRLRSFGIDGLSSGKKMNVTVLAQVLENEGLDFIYFDCCYMGNVETLYEMRKCAPVIVASAAEVPAKGMPYHYNTKHFFDTDISVKEAMVKAAQTTFTTYIEEESYVRGDCPCTMVVVDTSKFDELASQTSDIFKSADVYYRDGYDYQKYTTSSICYYYDFEDYVESIATDADKLLRWRKALDELVIYHAETPYIWDRLPISRSCGLSSYILKNATLANTKNYYTLSWYNDVVTNLNH